MSGQPSGNSPRNDRDDAWTERERYWARKLGRLRLGAEPLHEQIARYRRATWALTAVHLVIALIFVALFAAFRRADIGLILAFVLMIPVTTLSWADFAMLTYNVQRYQRELTEHKRRRTS